MIGIDTRANWILGARLLLAASCCIHFGAAGDNDLATSAKENESSVTVSVCGLHIVDTCNPAEPGQSRGSSKGTTITLLISAPYQLLSFNPEASKVVAFSDDQGKSLLETTPIPNRQFYAAGSPSLKKDSKTANVDIKTSVLPTSGAGQIHVAGTLTFKVADSIETLQGPLQLEKGTQAQLGPLSLRVKHIEASSDDPHLEPTHNYVHLEVEGIDPEAIQSFQLLDAGGKVVSEWRGRGFQRIGNWATGNFTLFVPLNIRLGTIEVKYWTDSSNRRIPFDVNVSVGL